MQIPEHGSYSITIASRLRSSSVSTGSTSNTAGPAVSCRQVLAASTRSFRARLSERFQQPDGGPGGAPVVVDFVANFHAFGLGGLRKVLGRSQPGTVGLLRRE